MICTAISEQGDFVHVSSAQRGQLYLCPHCGSQMLLKRSPLNRFYFAAKSGCPHKNAICQKMANSKKIRNPQNTSPDQFHSAILAAPKKRTTRGGGDGPGGGGQGPGDEEKEVFITSLRHLHELVLEMSSDMPIRNGYLSDILINSKIMGGFLLNREDLGCRVIVAKPDYLYNNTMTIRFCLAFTKSIGSGKEYLKLYFYVHYPDKDAFTKAKTKLFQYNASTGKVEIKFPSVNVFIHGDWKVVPCSACKPNGTGGPKCQGKWSCIGYAYESEFRTSKQLYCPYST